MVVEPHALTFSRWWFQGHWEPKSWAIDRAPWLR